MQRILKAVTSIPVLNPKTDEFNICLCVGKEGIELTMGDPSSLNLDENLINETTYPNGGCEVKTKYGLWMGFFTRIINCYEEKEEEYDDEI